jgi:hypothetical protein
MSPQKLEKALTLLAEWKPGQCNKDLLGNIKIDQWGNISVEGK